MSDQVLLRLDKAIDREEGCELIFRASPPECDHTIFSSLPFLAVYRRAFSMFDYQKSGEIDVDKICTILNTLGNQYDEAELDRLIRQEDTEGEKNEETREKSK